MILTRTTRSKAWAFLEEYSYSIRKQRVREQKKRRVQFLAKNPGDLREDDLHVMATMDGRTVRPLFDKWPEIEQRYQEYRDTPDTIVSSLHTFLGRAYRHTKLPGIFTDGWHIRAICRELEAVYRGETPRLMLNQPPASMKSVLCNVIFPAWAWAQNPEYSVMQYAYNDDLPKRDGRTLSTLVKSDWYRRQFPHVKLLTDTGTDLRTSAGGWRIGTGWEGSATGFHPNVIFIDDPTKAGDVYNKPSMLQKLVRWYASTIPSRGMIHGASIVLLMQRLATSDLCGVILNESSFGVERAEDILELDGEDQFHWRHVCLPMFYDPAHPYLYEHDPRKEPGEILWPEKYTVRDIRARMREMEMDPESGGSTTAAQFDQNPLATQGALFEGLRLAMISQEDLPRKWRQGKFIRGWDHAASLSGDYTAGVLLCEHDGIIYVVDAIRFKKRATDRDETIAKIAEWDRKRCDTYRVARERLAGPDGEASFQAFHNKLSKRGVLAMAMRASKSKIDRATAVASGIKHGEVRIFDNMKEGTNLLNELRLFPYGQHDDYVDALAHAYNALVLWRQGKV